MIWKLIKALNVFYVFGDLIILYLELYIYIHTQGHMLVGKKQYKLQISKNNDKKKCL